MTNEAELPKGHILTIDAEVMAVGEFDTDDDDVNYGVVFNVETGEDAFISMDQEQTKLFGALMYKNVRIIIVEDEDQD